MRLYDQSDQQNSLENTAILLIRSKKGRVFVTHKRYVMSIRLIENLHKIITIFSPYVALWDEP